MYDILVIKPAKNVVLMGIAIKILGGFVKKDLLRIIVNFIDKKPL